MVGGGPVGHDKNIGVILNYMKSHQRNLKRGLNLLFPNIVLIIFSLYY